MKLSLVEINYEALKQEKDYLNLAVARIAEKVRITLTSEQVLNAVYKGEAHTYLLEKNNNRCGLLVLSYPTDHFSLKTMLYVELAFIHGRIDKLEFLELMTDKANSMNADIIRFASPRKGWFSFLSTTGFREAYIFTKYLSE